ncbi:MAG: glutaminase [Anaerolineaceae bacterium]|nr:glutaminase [Anaerolineaceae bacterium]
MTNQEAFRPPSVPLITHDPYLSVWSATDNLSDAETVHWTGKPNPLCGIIRVDGTSYVFMGGSRHQMDAEVTLLPQTDLRVTPTRSIYTFEVDGIQLVVTFLSPLLPHDLDVMARPLSYIDLAVSVVDGQSHDVSIYLDVSGHLVVNTIEQPLVWGRHRISATQDALWLGSQEQQILGKDGDDLRIDWGYLYSMPIQSAQGVNGLSLRLRETFVKTGQLPVSDWTEMPRNVGARPPAPASAWVFDLDAKPGTTEQSQLMIAYDDLFSVEYMYRRLRPYWRRNKATAVDLLQWGLQDYKKLREACEQFDDELMADLESAGGAEYAQLSALAFRQCIAAHKLVEDLDGTLLFLSKENFSNGCMATVDVAYPASPFFLLFNPALLEAMLTPVLDYAGSSRWPHRYAPHDIGRYPLANGQVYGGAEENDFRQMPVEECGNMLLMVATLCEAQGSTAYAKPYWPLLAQWADYLLESGLDPANQLCTDDFAGHLAHNVNLSIKAIEGLGAYAELCRKDGQIEEADRVRAQAEQMAQQWQEMAFDGDHYRLAFDQEGTWSQKYNLVWDVLLDLNLFPKSVAETELAYYRQNQAQYGLPLDNRSTYTKLDWIIWSACLTQSQDDFEALVAPIYKWLNETPSRVPLSDWYYTDTGQHRHFQARSVVGGVFIKLLYDRATWAKWRQKAL